MFNKKGLATIYKISKEIKKKKNSTNRYQKTFILKEKKNQITNNLLTF